MQTVRIIAIQKQYAFLIDPRKIMADYLVEKKRVMAIDVHLEVTRLVHGS
jgi:hypothetical protein